MKQRVAEQLKTAAIKNHTIVLDESAERDDGTIFSDHDVRAALVKKGSKKHELEWMHCTLKDVKLIKFATRIPAFMYLTDFRENTLQDVITKIEPGLFETVTGLTVKDFHLLVRLRVFNTEQMNQARIRLPALRGCLPALHGYRKPPGTHTLRPLRHGGRARVRRPRNSIGAGRSPEDCGGDDAVEKNAEARLTPLNARG